MYVFACMCAHASACVHTYVCASICAYTHRGMIVRSAKNELPCAQSRVWMSPLSILFSESVSLTEHEAHSSG